MSLGKRIAALRKEKGFTQEQLAEKVGVTRQAISKWELEQSAPDFDCINQLSVIFDVTTDFLIKGEVREERIVIDEKKINRVSGMIIVGIIIALLGVLQIIVTLIFYSSMDDMILNSNIGVSIMVLLNGLSIILAGVELVVVKKHRAIGVLCVALSIISLILVMFVVPEITSEIENEKIANQSVTVPNDSDMKIIFTFNFSIYNIVYIINMVIVMIQGLVIGFRQHNLYNIVLSLAAMFLTAYVVLFGDWYAVSEILLPILFLCVSIFLTVNYHLQKKEN